jgi:hypothetical protein
MVNKTAAILLVLLFAFGCMEPKWDVYSDGKFSMGYPVGTEQQTGGDEIFKTMSQGCQITVSRFENQPSFMNFINYVKGMWENTSGLTIENEYIGSSVADFTVRASDEKAQYKGSINVVSCDSDIYITIVGCGRDVFVNNQKMVEKIIDSVECG